jgi:hypothetical protein
MNQAQELHPGLWQGSWPSPGSWLGLKGFSTLVLCAEEYQPPFTAPLEVAGLPGMRASTPWPGVEVVYAPNDDHFSIPPSRDVLRQSIRAARIVADRLNEGRKVLITCWQGRNRSGLVSALSLHFYLGITGAEATRIVQTRRNRGLRNPVFIDLLSRVGRVDHPREAVTARPGAPVAHFQTVPALRAP